MKKKKFEIKKMKNKLKNDYFILTLIFLIITPIFLTPWIHGNDGVGYYAYVRSVFIDKNLDFKNEKMHFNETMNISSIRVDPTTGKYFDQYPFGTSLLWSPYFLVGHFIAFISGSEMDGYSMPYIYMICLGSAINVFIGLLLAYNILRKYFKKNIALLSLISIWLASPLFYYTYFESSGSHANSFFTITLFFYFWHNTLDNRSAKQWMLLGFLAGLAVLVRYQDIIILGLLLADALNFFFNRKNIISIINEIKKYVLSASIFFLTLVPQLMIISSKNGSVGGFRFDGQFHLFNIPINLLEVLFSSQHGLFNWMPILLFAFLGLFLLYKKNKRLFWALLTIFILNLVLISGWSGWYAGQSFGHRMFINITVVFIFGLASLIEIINRKIPFKYILALCLLFILWNFGLMMQYGSRMIDAERAVSLKERVYNNLVEVPRKFFLIIKQFFLFKGNQ